MGRKKIIVTGGMGYIGSHTVVELETAGYNTVIVDNLSNSDAKVLEGIEKIIGKQCIFSNIDLTNEAATKLFFERHYDAIGVIHFAALKSVGESVSQPLKYYQNNLGSLLNVLNEMQITGIKNLIFSSSCTVYGQANELPVTEETKVRPAASPYGSTKQISETIIKDTIASNKSILKSIALRYFNPIGAHASAYIGETPVGIPNNLLPYITQTAIGDRDELKVFGNDYDTRDGTAIRDYIHVVDLAKAHVRAIERLVNEENNENYEVFNLGTGNGNTVLEVINSFEKMSGLKLNYSFTDRREGDIESVFADATKANNELKWKANLNLDDMTFSAWEWEKRRKK